MHFISRTRTALLCCVLSSVPLAAIGVRIVGSGAILVVLLALLVGSVPAGVFAARSLSLPWSISVALTVVAGCALVAAGVRVAGADTSDTSLRLLHLATTTGLFWIAASVVHRRRGGLTPGDVLDAVGVALGLWLCAWVIALRPSESADLASADFRPTDFLIGTSDAVVSILLIGISLCLLTSQRRPAPSLVALTVALVAGVLVDVAPGLLGVTTVAALLIAITHPSAPVLDTRIPAPRFRDLPERLASILVLQIVPVALTVGVSASGTTDRTVRVVCLSAILVVISSRLVVVLRSQVDERRSLDDLATTDPLTGLPTKVQALGLANSAIAERDTDAMPSCYVIDLDNFAMINQGLGHDIGDEVLAAVGERIGEVARDIGAHPGRISADEFVVFDPVPTDSTEAGRRAALIRSTLSHDIVTSTGPLTLTASCGIASTRSDRPVCPTELLRRALIAVDDAKREGRDRVAVFDAVMTERAAERLDLERALHLALDRNQLHLVHQPIVDVESGEVCGVEALIRWRRCDGTMVPPDLFIPIAEECGLIDRIGTWVLCESLHQLRRWSDEGVVGETVSVSVNVSPHQLIAPRFAETVHEALSDAGIAPERLWLEVTETMIVHHPEVAGSALEEIHASGVCIALDDFGTGYSSLSLLHRFPIQRIKIDRTFVDALDIDGHDSTLARAVVGLGSSMGMDIVAEGVETMQQLEILRDLRCAKAQGYLFSRPVLPSALRSTVAAIETAEATCSSNGLGSDTVSLS